MICGPPITAQSGHALRSPLTLGIISGNPFQNAFTSTVRTLHKYGIAFSGCVWIGTGGEGVVRLLSDRNIPVQHNTRNDGLSSDFIRSRRSRSIMVWARMGVTSKHPCVMFLRWSRGIAKISKGSSALESRGGVTKRKHGNIPAESPARHSTTLVGPARQSTNSQQLRRLTQELRCSGQLPEWLWLMKSRGCILPG